MYSIQILWNKANRSKVNVYFKQLPKHLNCLKRYNILGIYSLIYTIPIRYYFKNNVYLSLPLLVIYAEKNQIVDEMNYLPALYYLSLSPVECNFFAPIGSLSLENNTTRVLIGLTCRTKDFWAGGPWSWFWFSVWSAQSQSCQIRQRSPSHSDPDRPTNARAADPGQDPPDPSREKNINLIRKRSSRNRDPEPIHEKSEAASGSGH